MLDLLPFERAIARLEDALQYFHSDLAKNDPRLASHLRAAVIQAFEFTYELAYKNLRRYLQMTEPSPDVIDQASFYEVIRLAYERGLLQAELSSWKEFRANRGATSHTYSEQKAEDVLKCVPAFLAEARYLHHTIQTRQRSHAAATV